MSSEIRIHQSGDPFVNSGLIAIELITGKRYNECSKDELKKAAEWLVRLYLKPAWSKELQSLFPNSKYINSSIKDKWSVSVAFLNSLIDYTPIIDDGNRCMFCGEKAYFSPDYRIYKSNVPLTGSGSYRNFFPSFHEGLLLCTKCLLAFQFAPVISYKVGGKPCQIGSNNVDLLYRFGKESLKYIYEKLADGSFDEKSNSGLFDEGFKNMPNALFNLAYKFCEEYSQMGIFRENDTITLYKVDNYNQSPSGIEIYSLPSNVFSFVATMMNSPAYKQKWFSILRPYYAQQKKKDDTVYWKTMFNRVHVALLNGDSILRAFKKDSEYLSKLPWVIVETYEINVRNMHKERIDDIKNFADKIAELLEKDQSAKKRIFGLISAKNLPEFRTQLRILSGKWQGLDKPESMVSYDEYVKILTPGDYTGWTEVRDLIIIRLYEKLHPILAKDSDNNSIDEKQEEN